ncbi:MAG TPA: polysaccharide deacetylase family protein [Miltoncostaeaceae bacterium]|nr:polysaccharide deacetylase family protein [Miltoncostaeaceae bacterium]
MSRVAVELSFDDGPDPVWTPAVLDALAAEGAQATFFVLGPRALEHRGVLARIAAEGHEIGLHAWEHVRHGERTRADLERDTDRALAALAQLGVRPRRWRTPWGDVAAWTEAVAADRGLDVTGWTADSHDWRGDPAEAMLAALVPDLGPGGMVLMHDGLGPGALRGDCRETVRLIGPLCGAIRGRGWDTGPAPLGDVLAVIAAGATARDAAPPAFPEGAMRLLERAGVAAAAVPGARPAPTPGEEWALVRRVARADGSLARILDGHLNAVERVALLAPEPLRGEELAAVAAGERRMGVWGADPLPAEGPRAALHGPPGDRRITGEKVFCSGAGGIDRALVTAADRAGRPLLALVDLSEGVSIDRGWYRGSGLRTAESHRVRFDDARVLAVLGAPGELAREPWFSRDAIRTAACWAGIADRAADAALAALAGRPQPGDLEALAAGRILGAVATTDRWLDGAAREAADPGADLRATSVQLRAAVADACRTILDEAARATGSRPLVDGGHLDRCRRDLDLFLLQHRLDPMVARLGRAELERRT